MSDKILCTLIKTFKLALIKEIVNTMKQRVIAIEEGKIVRDEQQGDYGYEN